jgi:hypothetical protein
METAALAGLYLKLGIVGFVLVCFMSVFMYMIYKQMKTLDKIYTVMYDENSNNLTLQSAFDILEAQHNLSKYAFIETFMRIYHNNNIHDPIRQKLIKDNLNIVAKNLYDRDMTVLSRLHYKNISLNDHLLKSCDYDKIAIIIYDNLLLKYSPTDILAIMNNEFDKIINASCKHLEKFSI